MAQTASNPSRPADGKPSQARAASRQSRRDTADHRRESLEGVVFVVDSNEPDRLALVGSLREVGIVAEGYESAEDLLASWTDCGASCVVTEVRLPGMSGLELQRQLAPRSPHTTFVFLTGHSDVASAVAAIREGAVDFLEKFLVDSVLARRIGIALRESVRRRGDAGTSSHDPG